MAVGGFRRPRLNRVKLKISYYLCHTTGGQKFSAVSPYQLRCTLGSQAVFCYLLCALVCMALCVIA